MNSTSTTAGSAPAEGTSGKPPRLLDNRNLRWLAGGGLISMLGDQFTLLALPWLVLRLTGDPLALGTVIAAMGVPRALLMLVGGALVDRHAPARVLLVSRLACAALLAALALLVATGAATLPWIHAFAVTIGIATAFAHPASSAILPRSVPPALIRPANALLMSMRQATMLIGPLLGAALIAASASHAGHHPAGLADGPGLAAAFALDAASFIAAALALLPVKVPATAAALRSQSIVASIAEGLRALWNDPLLRAMCLYVTAIGLLVGGPLQVALPLLAERQLHGDAATLGLLTAGHGAGILAGLVLAGRLKGRRAGALGTLGTTVLLIDGLAGLVFIALGQATGTWQAIALLAPIGAMAGFVQVAVMSWIQSRVPPQMLGRAMSVLMVLILGLAPLSSAAAGWLLRLVPASMVFAGCGLAMLLVVAAGMTFLPIRRIDDAPPSAA